MHAKSCTTSCYAAPVIGQLEVIGSLLLALFSNGSAQLQVLPSFSSFKYDQVGEAD